MAKSLYDRLVSIYEFKLGELPYRGELGDAKDRLISFPLFLQAQLFFLTLFPLLLAVGRPRG